jgi:hypothetical protein
MTLGGRDHELLYFRWPRFAGEGETRTANHPNTRHTKRSCGSWVEFPGSGSGSDKASNVVGSISGDGSGKILELAQTIRSFLHLLCSQSDPGSLYSTCTAGFPCHASFVRIWTPTSIQISVFNN